VLKHRALWRLGQFSVLGGGHAVLDGHQDGLDVAIAVPVGQRGEALLHRAVGLIHLHEVDARDEAHDGGGVGVLGATGDAQLVEAAVVGRLRVKVVGRRTEGVEGGTIEKSKIYKRLVRLCLLQQWSGGKQTHPWGSQDRPVPLGEEDIVGVHQTHADAHIASTLLATLKLDCAWEKWTV
jgi:hypothetical protein